MENRFKFFKGLVDYSYGVVNQNMDNENNRTVLSFDLSSFYPNIQRSILPENNRIFIGGVDPINENPYQTANLILYFYEEHPNGLVLKDRYGKYRR